MTIKRKACGRCHGYGYVETYIPFIDDKTGRCKIKTNACKACNGNGYAEYAEFTVEEAKAILKHCGLDKE